MYICNMDQKQKEKFGDWLMDIAKYMFTALVLSSMLSDMKNPGVMVCVIVVALLLFTVGLILVRKDER